MRLVNFYKIPSWWQNDVTPYYIIEFWPRPDLMTKADKGRRTLTTFGVEFSLQNGFYFYNDIDEIATRMAQKYSGVT